MSSPDWLEHWLKRCGTELVTWRRYLHAHPQLAWAEQATTEWVGEHLVAAGLEPTTMAGGTGLLCDVGDGPGPLVALRADMDALPVRERTGAPYASTVDGVAHACGHDAHTTVLLGAGLALAGAGELAGRVRLVFQPAEERMPGGALSMVDAGALDGVSRIFALHCDPHLRVGQVGVRVGPLTSAADVLSLELTSPGGHTARPAPSPPIWSTPWAPSSPGLPAVLGRRLDPRSGTVLVWGAVAAGEAANAIPQSGVLRGTLRDRRPGDVGAAGTARRRGGGRPARPDRGGIHAAPHPRRPRRWTTTGASARLLRAAVAAGLGEHAVAATTQSSGGEDFAWYLEKVPGAMGRLGVWPGTGAMLDLHQPTFDLDERALQVGVRTLVHAALETFTHRGRP